jgi:ABC-2 type transport system permease protein
MTKGIWPVFRKEIRELLRDPYTLGIAAVFPLLLLFLFAYALNLDVKAIPVAVYDQDRTAQSRAYAQSFVNADIFVPSYQAADYDEPAWLLDTGRVQAVLVIPPGFARDLAAGRPAQAQTLVDGTFPTSAQVVRDFVVALNEAYTARVAGQYGQRQGNPLPLKVAVQPMPRILFNPDLKSLNFIVPGLFTVILMAFPPLLSTLAIVREKEHGSIQQVFVSPLQSYQYILGKMLPYVFIAYLEMMLVLAAGLLWFRIPLRGDLGLFLLASLPYVFGTVAIGLLVSTLTRSQVAAMLLTIVLTLMPSFLFSGFMFPIFTMPKIMQFYSFFFPARYFNDITTGIFLKGVGLEHLGLNLLILTGYTLIIVVFAAGRFKKKIA